MTYSFVAYIDESGDDGLGNFRAPGSSGASHWLVISACIYRYSFDLEAVRWRDEILDLMPSKKRRNLHFSNLNHTQRIVTTQKLANKPIRAIGVLSNKTLIPVGTYSSKNQLYFYLTRYLIERISWLCRDLRPSVPEGDGRVQITFSRRGGMSYGDFAEYLRWLRLSTGTTNRIHWPIIDIDGIQALDHSTRAGLQIADVVASALAAGIEPDAFGNCESRYAENLRPIVYRRGGNYLSYGFKLVPHPSEIVLTADQLRTIQLFKQKRQPPGP